MTTPNPDFINFGGVLIPEQDSQAHFAFTGTTGSGKTMLMRLLQQSTLCHVGAGLGYRAIVYDAKQDAMKLLSAYCDRSRLFTLNPFDDRGVAWDIAADVTEPRVALALPHFRNSTPGTSTRRKCSHSIFTLCSRSSYPRMEHACVSC